ncbi:putative Mg2+ transporter -like Zinc transport protein [Rosellinia necatrix]|uniref:Putative Mg2+ transporter-like Zinc transport protein n=1 Tax=Rosellinia necatrix TaxID=77044 RepID=A0A1W2TS57_ROSNE|nr:putative Mg2+ transporter -like Zinc transport protein [Rosellinia necatrix]
MTSYSVNPSNPTIISTDIGQRSSNFHAVPSNSKPPRSIRQTPSRHWLSFESRVPLDTSIQTSVLDHVTNAEDIYETSLFSIGSQVTVFQPNSDWESCLLKQLGGKAPVTVNQSTTLTISEFLTNWKATLMQDFGCGIPTQFVVLVDTAPSVKRDEMAAFSISSDQCDELVSTLKMCPPFLPCLWTTKIAHGFRQFGYAGRGGQCQAIDIWYTVPVSVTVKGEGNLSLASSTIYSRYVTGSPQTSLVMIFLRYNWQGSSLDGRPTGDYAKLLDKFKVAQHVSGAESRQARNGCQWHLAPQVAYFGMALGLWRQGLSFLNSFTHDQEVKIHRELSGDTEHTTISIRSVHLRLKYLHEEIENLQSICLSLDFLYKYWLQEATKQREVQGDSGVSSIDDLFILRDEFGIQIRGREELVKRLSNIQNLYFNLTTSKIAQASKSDSTAMKTIAVVTAVFFPATFIATFLSTTFFNYSDSLVTTSSSIWIYFAVTIPVTIIVLGAMFYWLKRRPVNSVDQGA